MARFTVTATFDAQRALHAGPRAELVLPFRYVPLATKVYRALHDWLDLLWRLR